MSDKDQQNELHDDVNKKEEEKSKDIPSVGKESTPTNWVGVAILVLVCGIIVYSFFSSQAGEEKSATEEKKNFKVAGHTNETVFKREKPKKKKESRTSQPSRDEILAALAAEKRKQELAEMEKAAEIAKKLEQSKRSSPMRILSGGTKQSGRLGQGVQSGVGAIDPPQKVNDNELDLGKPKQIDNVVALQINDTGKMIAAGKFIKGVLETAIDSTLPGQVRAIVSNDIYSENGQRVLIGKGSRLVGQYQSGVRQGQNRVFVIWSHVTTPTGVQIGLESTGTDALGVAGLSGDYDSHFFKRFGGALLLSIIEEASEENKQTLDISGGNSLQRASAVALENSINIPPTIYVDQGEPINVFIARNLRFESVL